MKHQLHAIVGSAATVENGDGRHKLAKVNGATAIGVKRRKRLFDDERIGDADARESVGKLVARNLCVGVGAPHLIELFELGGADAGLLRQLVHLDAQHERGVERERRCGRIEDAQRRRRRLFDDCLEHIVATVLVVDRNGGERARGGVAQFGRRAVPPLVALARSASSELRDAATRSLAAIAVDNQDCRDYVLKTIIEQTPSAALSVFNPATTPLALDTTLMLRVEMNQLAQEAGIGAAELEQLYQMWGADANAQISRDQFADGLARIGVADPLVVEQSFSAFDTDGSGTIDFREFVSAIAVLNGRGTADDRMKLMFHSYDLDKSGFLEPDEVYAIYRTALIYSGYARTAPELEHEQLTAMVQDCFRKVDVNGDGRLSFDEFKLAIESSTIVSDCFVKVPFAN
eukprot:TRINITY_DN5873_c0_g2_i1.p1 TRINITY_DN5873_c0_g2~~TRINITY_DN5873_c0_g2_i1.p1  ORF type:complete len:403 (+),score=192.01 TRINITY_DN5873_c0_g2_i1:314-1522(+)